MGRVLVVENSDTVRTMLCDAAKAADHTIDCAITQHEAEELISAGLYDLVICTMVLPDGSGLELAVKAADLGMGTMVMSGHPDALKVTTLMGVTHLQTPYSVEEFRKLIDAHLGV